MFGMVNQIKLAVSDEAHVDDRDDGVLVDHRRACLSSTFHRQCRFSAAPICGDRNWALRCRAVDVPQPDHRMCRAPVRQGVAAQAIILTHGHFDHVGSVEALAEEWDCPVYAHPLEQAYLDGTASYPPADPWVGGGLVALLSPLFPRSPTNRAPRLRLLPEDGSVPGMPGWQWIYTPGHTPEHVSLWREQDRTLLAGDAVITHGTGVALRGHGTAVGDARATPLFHAELALHADR